MITFFKLSLFRRENDTQDPQEIRVCSFAPVSSYQYDDQIV